MTTDRSRIDRSSPRGRLDGISAVVTGAASGIGAAIASVFAEEGASLVLSDRSAAGEEIARQVRADFFLADVTVAADVERLRVFASSRSPKTDVLVASAGISMLRPFSETSEEDWDRTVRGNLTATYLTCKAFLPGMAAAKGGRVVLVASQLGLVGSANESAYSAAKAGIVNLARSLAAEYAVAGIRVNALCPGPTRTPLLERLISNAADPKAAALRMVDKTLLKRLAEPREIAAAALFLASDESSFVTGAALVADGGHTAI